MYHTKFHLPCHLSLAMLPKSQHMLRGNILFAKLSAPNNSSALAPQAIPQNPPALDIVATWSRLGTHVRAPR